MVSGTLPKSIHWEDPPERLTKLLCKLKLGKMISEMPKKSAASDMSLTWTTLGFLINFNELRVAENTDNIAVFSVHFFQIFVLPAHTYRVRT